MENVLSEVTESTFDTFIGETPVSVVDFSATWCGPCQALKPTIESLANDYSGKVNIGKVDIDQNPGLAAKFNVMSVPTLLFFKGGEAVDSLVGVNPKEVIQGKIQSLMS